MIPVILFAYARPCHLRRVLQCLQRERVPVIHAYADGPRSERDKAGVAEVRDLLRQVDWCELHLVEREENLGLGRNVLAGVTDVAARHEMFIVWEDDLICVPGTYRWMCEALRHYAKDLRVMSVSGWTHPRVTPTHMECRPYFDARADCWVWGSYARAWADMGETALQKMRQAERNGIAPDAYGVDLPAQARDELRKNIWAVRWLYHHFQNNGLCLRPPWSMVEHIGFDQATNAAGATDWINPPLRLAPPVPDIWPEAEEHAACRVLWTRACPPQAFVARVWRKICGRLRRSL